MLAVPLTLLRLIEKQPVAICGKVYCRLGCICSSLHSSMEIERNHCQKPSCILECVCRQRLRKKGVDESSALAMVFFSGTDQVSRYCVTFICVLFYLRFFFSRDMTVMQSLNRLPSLPRITDSSPQRSLWLMKTQS